MPTRVYYWMALGLAATAIGFTLMINHWSIAALISLLTAFGRHGFLYQLFYQLPYMATIRNPMKFMHPLNISLIILSGYGLQVLHRRYLAAPAPKNPQFSAAVTAGMKKFTSFDKKWAIGRVISIVIHIRECSDRSIFHWPTNRTCPSRDLTCRRMA